MKRKILKVGTRGSPLALAQTKIVCEKLTQVLDFIETEVVPIKTTGDKIQNKTLAKIGGKGLFTKEIEDSLLRGDIHIAVHSMKDMPTKYPDGLIISCVLEREDPRDVLIYKEKTTFKDLPKNLVVGTSSLRRTAQILHQRPDLKIKPLRGNVQTRLKKIDEGEVDATIMARAGLLRLGIEEIARHVFECDEMIPAVGQGAIGVECRIEDDETRGFLEQINHVETYQCLETERTFLQELGGSCQTPIGGYAEVKANQLHLRGFVAQSDGTEAYKDTLIGPLSSPEKLGVDLANRVLSHVGRDFFKRSAHES